MTDNKLLIQARRFCSRLCGLISVSAMLIMLGSCTVHLPQSSPHRQLSKSPEQIPEALLLDIGIAAFSSEAQTQDSDDALSQQLIRQAESHFMPVMLQYTLKQADHWGAVYVLPDKQHYYDLNVSGSILQSNPHTLVLNINVADASGRIWFNKAYTEHVGDNVYSDNSLGVNDPFQGIYTRIANDMAAFLEAELDAAALRKIHQVSLLRFGQQFAPALYQQYLYSDSKGNFSASRLPSESDPVHMSLTAIRQRDHNFHEALQRHYFNYVRGISETYFNYRRFSYLELAQLQEQQTDARNKVLGGVFLLGVAAATADIDKLLGSGVTAVTALGGVSNITEGIRSYPVDTQVIEELSDSFASNVQTEVIELDQDVIILSGNVQQIYQQWQEILSQMFTEDREG